MSNRKITGVVETFQVEVSAAASPSGGYFVSPKRTTLTVVVRGDLSKRLDLEKPITITQED